MLVCLLALRLLFERVPCNSWVCFVLFYFSRALSEGGLVDALEQAGEAPRLP